MNSKIYCGNELEGWDIAACIWCITDALNDRGIIRKVQN